jgi:iron complex transport system ATP-binding protein
LNSIAIDHLSVKLSDKVVLTDVSWAVPSGKLTALIGPNGSGKTTLLRSVCNLLPVLNGTVTIANKKLGEFRGAELARTLAWVPQHNASPFDFSCLETVLLGRYPWHLGYPQKVDHEFAIGALAALGMAEFAARSVFSLSSGERQRLFIARALACQTDILVLDEPCANLDIAVSLQLLNHLKRLTIQGKTVVLTMHDLNLARQFADHVGVLAHGKLAANGNAKTIVSPEIVDEVFGIRSEVSEQKSGSYLILKNTKLPAISPSIEMR